MASGARGPVEIDVDFTNPASWVSGMGERTRWLRDNAPVYWSEKSQLWLVSRFADVMRISTDPEVFTTGRGVRPGSAARLGLLEETGSRHAQLRAVLSRGFAPQLIRRLEGMFRPRAVEVVDGAVARGRVEFVQEVATPLAVSLFGDMAGLSDEERPRVLRAGQGLMDMLDPVASPSVVEAGRQGLLEASEVLREAMEARRRAPRGDMLSVLVGVTRADDFYSLLLPNLFDAGDERSPSDALDAPIDDDDLVGLLATIFVIGTRTTRSALTGAMQLLVENASERRVLSRNPDRIPGAVEEIMRLVSPVQSFGRTVLSGVDLGGERLNPDDRVLMLYGSANRDRTVFEDPDRFRIDRHPRHLGFGIGPHFCLGADLARMATQVFVEALVERVDEAAWGAEEPAFELAPSNLVREYAHMHVELVPFAAGNRAHGAV